MISLTKKEQRELSAKLKMAHAQAELSYATRLKVGAVIVKDWRTISEGRNGMPAGGSNICEEYVLDGPIAEKITKQEVTHAEMNAIGYAARNGISTRNCDIVLTHSPCYDCARLILSAGIKRVFYEKEYRITESIEFLKQHIQVIKIGE